MKKDVLTENDLMPIILYVPKNSVKISIDSTLIDEESDELYHAVSTMSLSELMEAHVDGVEWEDNNVKYCLTDLGRTELEKNKS